MGNVQGLEHNEDGATTCCGTPETRILPKLNDPRSPTEGITRTPIEVMCTPTAMGEIQGTALKFDTPVIKKYEDNQMHTDEEKKTDNGITATKRPYLETDIDALSAASGTVQHPRVKELRTKTELLQAYTDVQTSELLSGDSLCSRIDSVSFNDISAADDDPSAIVSDGEDEVENDYRPVEDWLITIEDERRSMSFESLEESLLREQADYERMIVAKEKPFLTPDSKKSKKSPHARRPLGCLTQNKIFEPIKSGLKKKAWRGIQEERERRGLSMRDENTPPPQLLLGKVSSAPGKLMRRRCIVDRDQDKTTVV